MYCSHCGKEVEEGALVCPSCGFKLKGEKCSFDEKGIYLMIAKIFSIIACVAAAATLIPLLWVIPMTKKVYKLQRGEIDKVSTAFKVCATIFMSPIVGIVLFLEEM